MKVGRMLREPRRCLERLGIMRILMFASLAKRLMERGIICPLTG